MFFKILILYYKSSFCLFVPEASQNDFREVSFKKKKNYIWTYLSLLKQKLVAISIKYTIHLFYNVQKGKYLEWNFFI